MNTVSGELTPAEEPKPQKTSWPWSRWLLLITLVLVAHVTLICLFGTHKPVKPKPVTNVPDLQLAVNSSEWLALNDPTLFALPNREGFAGPAWIESPPLHVLMDWTESPRWLQLPMTELGAAFNWFMQTNRFTAFQFDIKPRLRLTELTVPQEPTFPKTSTFRIAGDIAKRRLLSPMTLPAWIYTNDVLKPTTVQVLVNPAGEVISTVLLSSSGYASTDVNATTPDRSALEFARAARFAPAPGMTVGELIFDWRTIAPPATNSAAGP